MRYSHILTPANRGGGDSHKKPWKELERQGASLANTNNCARLSRQFKTFLSMDCNNTMLIYASDVAAAVGRNKYKLPWVIMESMWRRLRPDQFELHSTVNTHRLHTLVQQVEHAVATETAGAACAVETQQVQSLVERATAKATELVNSRIQDVWSGDASAVKEQVLSSTCADDVRQLIRADMEGGTKERLCQTAQLLEAKEVVTKKVKSDVQCVFGTCREDASREQMVASRMVKEVLKDNKFCTMWMEYPLTASGTKWGVGGRVDGVDDQGRVVEIKNRTRRFFPTVPDYEMVQVQTYMALLNKDETVFVQQLNGNQRSTVIQRNVVMWSAEIVPALYKFMNLLDLFIADDSHVLREEWMCCDDKGKHALFTAWLEQGDDGRGDYVF